MGNFTRIGAAFRNSGLQRGDFRLVVIDIGEWVGSVGQGWSMADRGGDVEKFHFT